MSTARSISTISRSIRLYGFQGSICSNQCVYAYWKEAVCWCTVEEIVKFSQTSTYTYISIQKKKRNKQAKRLAYTFHSIS